MDGFAAALQALSPLLVRLRADWPAAASWEWDGRLDCALSPVAKADVARARATLTAGLPLVWTPDELGEAPPLIKQICARTRGLQPGQLVFAAQLPEGVYLYGLWWPWGSGANVSVRIGASHASVVPAVRAAFGL